MKTVSTQQLRSMKAAGDKFVCITAYDASFACAVSDAGIETILVGDSLGMVLQGHDSTVPVAVEDMAYHIACVAAGNTGAMIIGDMPFMAYSNEYQAMENATTLMQAGAHMVKMEGGQWLCPAIEMLVERGIPVCAHLGLTPQSVNTLGGYKVQGRGEESAERILADARAVEAAGASMLVLECVPTSLAAKITASLDIPTIGIGAGNVTDAQVLVLHDMLGLNPRPPRFVRNFMASSNTIADALREYADCVRDGSFPSAEHSFE